MALFDFLLSQVRTSQKALAGGKIYFYEAGTTTAKSVYLDFLHSAPAANPYTLDSNATAQLYGLGLYRVVIKDASGVTRYDRDNVSPDMTDIWIDSRSYATLALADAAAIASGKLLMITHDYTVSSDTTIASPVQVQPGSILTIPNGITMTINGGFTAYRSQVFTCVGTGSVVLNRCNVVRPIWWGAVGTGLIDDITPMTAACAQPSQVIDLERYATYLLTTELTLSGKRLEMNNATLRFSTAGTSTQCLLLKSGATMYGGLVEQTNSGTPSAGEYLCPIVIGNSQNSDEYRDISVTRIGISSAADNGNGIAILGNSHGVTLRNISFPSSATLGRGILVHWGGAGTPPTTTYHPNNITIDTITFGEMTSTAADGALIFLSSCHTVEVTKVRADHSVRPLVELFAGDYGSTYAENPELIMTGITLDGITCPVCESYGVYVDGKTGLRHRIAATVRNVTAVGTGAASSAGVLTINTSNVVVENCHMSGFYNGLRVGTKTRNITVRGGEYFANGYAGCIVTATSDYADGVLFDNVAAYGNGVNAAVGSANRSGIKIDNGNNVVIINGIYGDPSGTEAEQRHGIRVESAATRVRLLNNHCHAIQASPGGASSYSNDADDTTGNGNTAATGVTVLGGTEIIFSLSGDTRYGAEVTAAATITPTGQLFRVTGSGAIATINLPYTGFSGTITIIPASGSTWTTTTSGGNIGLASTAVPLKTLTMTYEPGLSKWLPSY